MPRVEIHGIERLAGGHEQAVALGPAEADVGADLGKQDQADADAVGGKDVHAVIAGADPAGGGVEVALDVDADAVGEAGRTRRPCMSIFIETNSRPLVELDAVDDVVRPDVARGFRVVGSAGVGDVECLVVGGEAKAVGLEEVVGDLGELAGLGVDPVDGLLDLEGALVPLVFAE